MAYQAVSIGTTANDGTGDSPRAGAIKINANFTELYGFNVFAAAAPTTGAHVVGEFVRNSNPSEQGTAGAKFILQGWTCVTAGTPGTWVANNVFTGN